MNYQLTLEQVNRQIEKKRDELSLLTTIRASLQLSIQQCDKPPAPEPPHVARDGKPSALVKRRARMATTMLTVGGKATLAQLAAECNAPVSSMRNMLHRLPQFEVDPEGYWTVQPEPEPARNDDDDRVRIHDLLGERGATKLNDIAIGLSMPVAQVTALLGHEWFRKTPDGWVIA